MKAKRPPPRDPDTVEEIVEDLAQQDVLPMNADPENAASPDEEMTAEEHAGRWDEPVGDQGHQAKRTALEDEAKASEVLVQRGVSEAEEELEELDADESSPEDEEEE